MSDLIKCTKCGKETNKYSPVCEYCSVPLERETLKPENNEGSSEDSSAQTISEHGKALYAELSKYSNRMKKCPFCAEEIQGEAIKCRYCGELIKASVDGAGKHKISFSKLLAGAVALVILVLLFAGITNLQKSSTAIKYDTALSPALKSDPAKADYVKRYVTVTDIGTQDEIDPKTSAATKYFYGTIGNSGNKTLIKVSLAVYYFDKKDRCIAEGVISPILGTKDKPNSVMPASSKDFKLPIMNTNPEWSGMIKEKIFDIEFL